jgi:hypothetical protein
MPLGGGVCVEVVGAAELMLGAVELPEAGPAESAPRGADSVALEDAGLRDASEQATQAIVDSTVMLCEMRRWEGIAGLMKTDRGRDTSGVDRSP